MTFPNQPTFTNGIRDDLFANSRFGFTGGFSPQFNNIGNSFTDTFDNTSTLDFSVPQFQNPLSGNQYLNAGVTNNMLGPSTNSGGGFLSGFNSKLGEYGNIGSAAMGLGKLGLGALQAYTGFQQLGLSKKALGLANKQFGFQKELANRNLANQAKLINTRYDNAAQVAAGLMGYGGKVDQETVDRYAAGAKKQYVDDTPIK